MSSEALLPGENGRNDRGGSSSAVSRRRGRVYQLVDRLLARAPTNGSRVAESLDYEPVQNDLYLKQLKERKETRHVYGYSGLTLLKNLVVVLTGILTGLTCVTLNKGVSIFMEFRNSNMAHLVQTHDSVIPAFLLNLAYGVSLAAVAACMVTFWAPTAAGAGVTLVMAYLNGTHIPNLLRMKTLITKVIGAMCSVASGLAIGPEGPMVHIGSCIASNITYAQCGTFLQRLMPCSRCNRDDGDEELSEADSVTHAPKQVWCAAWEELHEDAEHREFIAAGASAGLSAAFGAPIGGILFSMEEACSFWSRKVAWRCFITTILAAFTVSVISEGGDAGIIVFTNVHTLNNRDWLYQFPFMVLVAALGGGLGAAFNAMRRLLWKIRASRSRKSLRVLEALATVVFCVCAQFIAATYFSKCVDIPRNWNSVEFEGISWLCPEGQHSDLATAFWSAPDEFISRLFSVGHNVSSSGSALNPDVTGFSQSSLVIYCFIYLTMLALCAGICVPAGMFMPAVMLGAAGGLAAGVSLQQNLPPSFNIQPGLYALICATASLAGVFRSAISLVVLVVEGTRGINFLFGVIIAVITANLVGSVLKQDGVYESEIERDGNVFFLANEPPRLLSTLTAEKVMVKNPTCLAPVVPVREVLRVLRDMPHHGFPVVTDFTRNPTEDEGVGQLEGLVLRSQLLVLLRRQMWANANGEMLNPVHATPAYQFKTERVMRLFYRLRYTHHRYMATQDPTVATLNHALQRSQPLPAARDSSMPSLDGEISQDTVFDRSGMQFDEMHALRASASDHNLREETRVLVETLQDVTPLDNCYLDLRPFMNCAPLTVQRKMLASRVHRTFVTLGMRHLCVVNTSNRIVGIITRKDLEHASDPHSGSHGHRPHPTLSVSHSVLASTSGARRAAHANDDSRAMSRGESRGYQSRLTAVGERSGEGSHVSVPGTVVVEDGTEVDVTELQPGNQADRVDIVGSTGTEGEDDGQGRVG